MKDAKRRERPDAALQEQSRVRAENRTRLIEVLAELSEDQRMIIVLYEIEEVSMEEIELGLGLPLRTCDSRLEAARKHVEQRFRRKLRVSRLTPREVLLARDHEQRFVDSVFSEEREAIQIEALLRTGRPQEAEQRRRRFDARFPLSAYRRRLDGARQTTR